MDDLDSLIFDSTFAIKTLDDSGRFEGLAIPFGDADLTGDRFTAETEFGRSLKGGADLLYFHGLPKIDGDPNPLAGEIIGEAEFKTIDEGVWMTGQLAKNRKYRDTVRRLVAKGELGLSTGSAPHRVRREKNADGTFTIKTWPIIECSITPSPAHHRTSVYPIKTLIEAKGIHLGPDAEGSAAMGGLDRLSDMARYRISDHLRDVFSSRGDKLAACKGCLDEHAALGMKLVGAMLDGSDEDAVKTLLSSFGSGASPEPFLESCLTTASGLEQVSRSFAKLGPTKRLAIKTLRDALDAVIANARPDADEAKAMGLRLDSLLTRFKG